MLNRPRLAPSLLLGLLLGVSPLVSSRVAAQDGGVFPPGCAGGGGWGTSVDGLEVPANIPSFHVNLFGAQSEAGLVRLSRRTSAGDVPVEADVTMVVGDDGLGGTFHSYVLAPRGPLAAGVTHVFQWSGPCVGANERTYGVAPAAPLPTLPATLTATLIQTVRDGRRDERFVRVDLTLSSDILTWASALSFDVVVDDTDRASLFLPFESTMLLRRQLFVECAGRREDRDPRVTEGAHDFRAEVGGFGVLEPLLEVSTTANIDCDHPLYVHANGEVPLTPAEIDALGPEAPPPTGEGGIGWDAAITSERDASVAGPDGGIAPAPSGGCSAAPSRGAMHGVWMVVGLALVVRRRR